MSRGAGRVVEGVSRIVMYSYGLPPPSALDKCSCVWAPFVAIENQQNK